MHASMEERKKMEEKYKSSTVFLRVESLPGESFPPKYWIKTDSLECALTAVAGLLLHLADRVGKQEEEKGDKNCPR